MNESDRREERLKRWEKDHIHGQTQVVIKYGQPASGQPVPLNEFGDTRVTFQLAANELKSALFAALREDLENLGHDIGQSPMPPQVSSNEYKSQSRHMVKQYVDAFRAHIADLKSALKDRWDENEQPFSEDEIEDFSKSFGFAANRLRKENVSGFNMEAWNKPGIQTADENVAPYAKRAPTVQERELARTPFGRNIDRLRKECGWSFDLLAEKTQLDKKLILGHVNKGKGAQPGTLKIYADVFSKALGRTVTVAELEN